MPLAGPGHVLVAGKRQFHRAAQLAAGQGRQTGPDGGRPLLAAEGPSQAPHVHGDVLAVDPQHPGRHLLDLGRALGGAVEDDLVVLARHRPAGLGLQVEVLLPAGLHLSLDDVFRFPKAPLHVAAHYPALRRVKLPLFQRLPDGQHRIQLLETGPDQLHPALGRLLGLPGHHGQRLSGVGRLLDRKQGLVEHGVADLVLARDVLVGEDPEHAGGRLGITGVQRQDPGPGVGAGEDLEETQPLGPGLVDHEARAPGDVQWAGDVEGFGFHADSIYSKPRFVPS